ncbi:uncharacterized protein EDB91DRAFT_1051204 [Suillus paluster]|uniref:uncharacterized protein n=1 Tax=Suillus paluster TaxID=48578 RepID=UPI001B86AA67|nr:uncharacterized protein EDB91DRAFT_1051204 [Suillus paluster]KAG1743585.1 hypothetical protein EDB91DRAFT_1051204 [Suillus paluster]
MSSTEFFWNAVTGAIAPDLFEAGSAAISEVHGKTHALPKPVPVSRWPLFFSRLEVIANCLTLPHRDPGGARSHYDMLMSLGIGHDTIFSIKDLEADLDYFPGAMCFICGKVLEHLVGPWKKGEHFVLAHFMKDKVHDRVGVTRPPFPVQGDFLHLVGSEDRPKKRLRKK